MEKRKNIFQIFAGFSIGPMIGAIIGFFSVIILSWLISPEENGKVSIFQLYINLGVVLMTLGYDQAFTREFNQVNTSKLLAHVVIIPAFFAILNIGSLFLFPNFFSQTLFGAGNQYVYLVYAAAITLTTLVISRFTLLIIRMQEKGLLYSVFSVLSSVIILVLNVLLLVYWKATFESIIISNMVANIAVMALSLFVTRKSWRLWKIKFDKQLFKKLTYFALPLVPAMIITYLFQSIDRYSLMWYSTLEELGLFNLCMSLSMAMTLVQNIFTNAWIPIAYRWNAEGTDHKYFEIVGIILCVFLSLAFFGLMVGREVLALVIGPQYYAVITIFPFLTLNPIMYTVSEITGLGIPFSRKTKYILFLSIIVLAINFLGNFILVPKFGALGATISTGIAYVIFFWLRTIISRQLWYKFKYKRYILFTFLVLLGATYNTVLSREIALFLNIIILLVIITGICFIYFKNKDKINELFKTMKG